jgi:hypothetical protein
MSGASVCVCVRARVCEREIEREREGETLERERRDIEATAGGRKGGRGRELARIYASRWQNRDRQETAGIAHRVHSLVDEADKDTAEEHSGHCNDAPESQETHA